MGGQHNYFGLWLSTEFGKGHSKAKPTSTTYGNTQLSAKEDFLIDVVEAWGIGNEPKLEEDDETVSREIIALKLCLSLRIWYSCSPIFLSCSKLLVNTIVLCKIETIQKISFLVSILQKVNTVLGLHLTMDIIGNKFVMYSN